MAEGYLTTHVLDTASGRPAEGLAITLFALDAAGREPLVQMLTNSDGRTDNPILPRERFALGAYELIFEAGDYLRKAHGMRAGAFLNAIPIRFGMHEDSHFHVPLLLSPYGYSTYRGS